MWRFWDVDFAVSVQIDYPVRAVDLKPFSAVFSTPTPPKNLNFLVLYCRDIMMVSRGTASKPHGKQARPKDKKP